MNRNYDPRFNSLHGIDLKKNLAGRKDTTDRAEKARLLSAQLNEKFENESVQQELDFLSESCMNQLSQSGHDKKKQILQEKLQKQHEEWECIAETVANIVFESVPFDAESKSLYESSIKKHAKEFVVSLFENKLINTFMLTKSSSNVKKLMASAFLNEDGGELSSEIADAIKVKAIELVKKEIENAKQSDDVEDEIHNVKQDVSGSPDGAEAQGQEGGAVGAPGDDPSASGAVAATSSAPNQVPADQAPEQNVQEPSAGVAQDHEPEAPATDAEGGTSDGSAAAATQEPAPEDNSEEGKKEDDAFGVNEDYLEIRPNSFHLGHKRRNPSYQNQMFGKILTETSKQYIQSTGKLDGEKALGNATTLYCLFECLEQMGFLNEKNADSIFNKLIH